MKDIALTVLPTNGRDAAFLGKSVAKQYSKASYWDSNHTSTGGIRSPPVEPLNKWLKKCFNAGCCLLHWSLFLVHCSSPLCCPLHPFASFRIFSISTRISSGDWTLSTLLAFEADLTQSVSDFSLTHCQSFVAHTRLDAVHSQQPGTLQHLDLSANQ